MEVKDALEYTLAKYCCEKNAKICMNNCPLYRTEKCDMISFTNDDYEAEVIHTLKAFYESLGS